MTRCYEQCTLIIDKNAINVVIDDVSINVYKYNSSIECI